MQAVEEKPVPQEKGEGVRAVERALDILAALSIDC
jgi:hypothetical protein